MKNKFRIIVLLVISFQFCFAQIEKHEYVVENNNSDIKVEYSFLNNYGFKKLPFLDSTNFDNHKIELLLTKEQIKILNLDTVFKKEYLEFDMIQIGVNYRLELSENFRTIAIFFYFTKNELSSTLINYDSDFNVIDFKTIAADEIAESIFRTKSLIEKNKITISNFKYFNETITEIETFEIDENGRFIKTKR